MRGRERARLVVAATAVAMLAGCRAARDEGSGDDAGVGPQDASVPNEAGDRDAGAPDAGAPDAGAPEGPFRVLFDDTKDERAGNADWVIDDSAPLPSPAHPDREDDWRGGISSWGWELDRTLRYEVEQLASGSTVTFEEDDDQDLSRYDAFVVPEPNRRFETTEAEAIVAFVRAGGGLFIVANHGGSDRNNDGWDPPEVWNELFDGTGDPFGIRFDGNDITDSPDDNAASDGPAEILDGPFGPVLATTYYDGSTMTLSPEDNETVRGVFWRSGAEQGRTGVTFAVAELGRGRVAAIGDSSPADDGTGEGGLHDGWDDPVADNRELFLNTTAWLVGDRTEAR